MSATEEISSLSGSFEEKIKELSSEESISEPSSSDKEKSSHKRQRTATGESEIDPDTIVLVSFVVIPEEPCDTSIVEVKTTIGHLKEIDRLLDFMMAEEYMGNSSDILVFLNPEIELSEWKTFDEEEWSACIPSKHNFESIEYYLGEFEFREFFTHNKPIDLKQRKVAYQQDPQHAVTRVVFDYK